MRKDLLAWEIIWRMTAWGFGSGAGIGLLYGLLVIAVAGNIYLSGTAGMVGLLVGGFLGFGSGLLDGFVLAGITHFALPRRVPPARYRAIMCGVAALLTGVTGLLGFSSFAASLIPNGPPAAWIVYALVPALLAVVVAVIASAKIAIWVGSTTAVVPGAE